jgi:MFS transporter, ACDE family, multidrug resistance protein
LTVLQNKIKFFQKDLRIIYSITLMEVLGIASIAPALPKIQEQLNVGEHGIWLLITAFTFPGIFLTLFLGILADRIGRKTILVPSLLLFGISGGLCTFTNDFNVLVVLRFFQGIGAASLSSLNLAIIGDIYENKFSRTKVMEYNSAVLIVATAAFPAIGGALALIAWYYPFFVSVLAIPIGFWVMFTLKLPPHKNGQNFKVYLVNAYKCILKKEAIAIFAVNILSFIVLYGALITYFPFLMDRKFNASTLMTGSIMSLTAFSAGLAASKLTMLKRWFGEKQLLLLSFIFYAVASAIIPYCDHIYYLIIPVLLFGLAQGANLPNLMNILTGLAPLEQRAVFLSLNATILRIGQTVGPFIMGMVYGLWYLEGVYLFGSILSLTMFVIVFFAFEDKPSPKIGDSVLR